MVVFYRKLRGQRSKFTPIFLIVREANLELAMFDLGHNIDHACLRVIISLELAPTPVLDVSGMVGELITPAQVLVEEMAITSHCDDKKDDEGIASSKFEGNFSI
jgi:hypothetical protein